MQQQAGVGRHRPERGKLQAHPRKWVRITSAVAPLECFFRHNEGLLRYTLGNRARRCEHKIVSRIAPEGKSRRRSVDFYPEGELIWLEADVLSLTIAY